MEIWKDIIGYESRYQVSNLGNVKSLNYKRLYKEKQLQKSITKAGYYYISIYEQGKIKKRNIHSLVAEAFLNHKPNGYKLVVNHKNFIRTDNRVENLEIVTMRENGNKKHLQSSSQYVGVSVNKITKKYVAQIMINKKDINLGTFNTELEASEYYQKALKSISENKEIIIKQPNYSSNYKGVHFCNTHKKWISQIRINGKQKNLGNYKTEIEAHNAYQKALCAL